MTDYIIKEMLIMFLKMTSTLFRQYMKGEGFSNVALDRILQYEEELEQEGTEREFDKVEIRSCYSEYNFDGLVNDYFHLIEGDEEWNDCVDEVEKVEFIKSYGVDILTLSNGNYLVIEV